MATPHLNFVWTHDSPANLTFKLYENGVLIIDDIEEMKFSLLMEGREFGVYHYHNTAFDLITKLESVPGPTLDINFTRPAPPTGLTASFSG